MAICDFAVWICGRFIKYFDCFFGISAKKRRGKCQGSKRYFDEWSE